MGKIKRMKVIGVACDLVLNIINLMLSWHLVGTIQPDDVLDGMLWKMLFKLLL